jgi:hypothetical protein
MRHNVEHGIPRELSMVLGQESVQVGKFFVVHRTRASGQFKKYTATC